jgi:hypothetical protein
MTTEREAEAQFIRDVLAEAAHLLGLEYGDPVTTRAASFADVVLQAREAGENASDVARQLVDDGVLQ